MNDQLQDLLRQDAAGIRIPSFDVDAVITRGERRLGRRRFGVSLGVAAAVAAIAVGSALATRPSPGAQEPVPVAPSSPGTGLPEVRPGARPLVYAVGSTVHVGARTVEARDPVAFIEATDDGAVYEAALDGTVWFTDGIRTSAIGTSGCTACPTTHLRVVATSDSGSLVVWGDVADRRDQQAVEFVVYDTARRNEVARIPFPEPGRDYRVIHVGDRQVWFTEDDGVYSNLFRYDLSTGDSTSITRAQLRADLQQRPRIFTEQNTRSDLVVPGLTEAGSFRQVADRLVTVTVEGGPQRLTRANGDELRLRLPAGYRAPAPDSVASIAQWLDDGTVVLWSTAGGGDLPAQRGDLLVCELPDGTCRVEVARSAARYVAPIRG